MNTIAPQAPAAGGSTLRRAVHAAHHAFRRIPDDLVAAVARFGIAGVFWLSGQTKVEGFALNVVSGELRLGWPGIAPSALALFEDEYRLPLLAPGLAAVLAAVAEHVFPLAILLGLATRLSAAALLAMTVVIQVFVYPGAYATHATWAAVLLYLMAHGPGRWSADHWIARRWN